MIQSIDALNTQYQLQREAIEHCRIQSLADQDDNDIDKCAEERYGVDDNGECGGNRCEP
jgi:hypothetical protein